MERMEQNELIENPLVGTEEDYFEDYLDPKNECPDWYLCDLNIPNPGRIE